MTTLPNITTPPLFYYAVAAGMLLYLVKKFIAGEGWHLATFVRKELSGIINSVALTVLIAYLIPELVLYASDLPKLSGIAKTFPSLVSRVTVAFGALLGFTGGSIAFDLIPMLYTIPVVGPFLKSIVERMRSNKADKMAKDHGVNPNP